MTWLGLDRWCPLACAFALACGSNGTDDDATSVADGDATAEGDDDGPTEGSADDASDESSSVTQSSVSDADTSADASITDTDPSVSSESTDSSADSTTGGEMYCGLTDLAGGPWFELSHAGEPIADGSILSLECGGQGSLMFFLATSVGGWMPDGEDVYFSVTVDVEGYAGPTGHFFQNTMYGVYIGCEEFDGGGPIVGIAVIPPDEIADVTVLNGLPATVHVELLAEGNPTFDATVELAVPDDPMIGKCGFG